MLLALLLQDVVTLLDGKTVEGAIAYKVRGLNVDETFIAWKKIASIRDAADAAPAASEEARAEYASRRETGDPVTLATWCEKNGLLDEAEALLLDALAENGYDEAALKPAYAVAGRVEPVVDLRPPFAGRWHALPDTTKHHRKKVWAMYAIDFMKMDAKGSYATGEATAVEDYLGWNAPVLAAAGGEVVTVLDGFEDNPVNKIGDFDKANIVTIRHDGGEYTSYGHLRKGSVEVKAGDRVKAGQAIGRVGNSGASAVPHLHFTLMRAKTSPSGKGLWVSVPFAFAECALARVGKSDVEIALERARIQEDWTLACR